MSLGTIIFLNYLCFYLSLISVLVFYFGNEQMFELRVENYLSLSHSPFYKGLNLLSSLQLSLVKMITNHFPFSLLHSEKKKKKTFNFIWGAMTVLR